MKKIALLGSTGSIGTQTLDVAEHYPDDLKVVGLAAGSNIKKLEEQIRRFRPALAAVWDKEKADILRHNIADMDTRILDGMEGLCAVAAMDAAGELAWARMEPGDGNFAYRGKILDTIYHLDGGTLDRRSDYEIR